MQNEGEKSWSKKMKEGSEEMNKERKKFLLLSTAKRVLELKQVNK
jgi:hypothetical protein